MNHTGQASGVVVIRLRQSGNGLRAGWSDGPIPLPLPQDQTSASAYIYRPTTDRRTRSEYMRERVNAVLYGIEGDGRRQHLATEGLQLRGCTVTWLETLQMPLEGSEKECFLAIHLECGARSGEQMSELTADLGNLRDTTQGVRSEIVKLVQGQMPGAEIANLRMGFVVTHWVPDELAPSPLPGLAPEVAWPRVIAAANPAVLTSAQMGRSESPFDLDLSRSWRAAVMNAGAAFVGLSGPHDPFHEMAEILVHSVYLDALLLVLCQDQGIDKLSTGLGRVWDDEGTLADISALERRARKFRGQVWWTEVSAAPQVNRIFSTMQTQRDLAGTEQRLNEDIDGLVAYASARRADRTNRLLTVFTVAGIALGGAALIAEPGWALAWGVILSIVGVALVLTVELRSKRW